MKCIVRYTHLDRTASKYNIQQNGGSDIIYNKQKYTSYTS